MSADESDTIERAIEGLREVFRDRAPPRAFSPEQRAALAAVVDAYHVVVDEWCEDERRRHGAVVWVGGELPHRGMLRDHVLKMFITVPDDGMARVLDRVPLNMLKTLSGLADEPETADAARSPAKPSTKAGSLTIRVNRLLEYEAQHRGRVWTVVATILALGLAALALL